MWDELTTFLYGIVFGIALLVLLMGYEDAKSGQPWKWVEVAIGAAVMGVVLFGVYGMIFGW